LPPDTSSRGRVIKFTNCRVFLDGTFKSEDLWVRDGRVIDPRSRFYEAATFREYACDVIVDCEDNILCPGFLDLQINGARGGPRRATAAPTADTSPPRLPPHPTPRQARSASISPTPTSPRRTL
jgi:hypothetical protein